MTDNSIYLREMVPEDLDLLYDWENRKDWQHLSNIEITYSRTELDQFIQRGTDLIRDSQMRWMICREGGTRPLGTLDLFDLDKEKEKAKIGILIANQSDRRKGYALEAIQVLKHKMIDKGNVRELYAETMRENTSGNVLFTKAGFDLLENDDRTMNIYRLRF